MSAVIVGLNHVTSHLNTDTEVLREMVWGFQWQHFLEGIFPLVT